MFFFPMWYKKASQMKDRQPTPLNNSSVYYLRRMCVVNKYISFTKVILKIEDESYLMLSYAGLKSVVWQNWHS